MKIKRISIRNYRSIKKLIVNTLDYMVFVGKNNSGKSNIMMALDAFFKGSVDVNDFRKEGTQFKSPIHITVMFGNLNDRERQRFKGKLMNEGEASEHLILRFRAHLSRDKSKVEKSHYEVKTKKLDLEQPAVKSQYGGLYEDNVHSKSSNIEEHVNIPLDFKQKATEFLNNKSSGRFTKDEFAELRDAYVNDLLNKELSLGTKVYESFSISKRNPELDLGNFFFIPAVQDVEEETKYTARGKGNLSLLMNYIVDQMLDLDEKREREQQIQGILKDIYRIGQPGSQMTQLSELLNEYLKTFDESTISFDTELPNISTIIRNSLKVFIDDGIKTEVHYKGHGLQRYFMVILFKAWSEKLLEKRLAGVDDDASISTSTYFAIEEPELFLHPQFQRMMRIYLQNIAEDEGHQILLNTHSPHFIEFNNIYQVAKVIKKDLNEGTKVVQPLEYEGGFNIKEKELVCTWGSAEERRKYRKINRVNMNYYLNPARNEMFFADKVVLVEGQTEKMMFQAWANHFFGEDISLISSITYIDCIGKHNIRHYIGVLSEFGTPMVVVVDTDRGESYKLQEANRYIKQHAQRVGCECFELDPDFEAEFDITEEALDSDGSKRNKPYYAFNKYFEVDGTPKEAELDALKSHPKLKAIFKEIYGKNL